MAAKKRTKRRTMFQETWHRLLKNKGAVIGMAFLVLLCIIALVSPFVFDYDSDVIAKVAARREQSQMQRKDNDQHQAKPEVRHGGTEQRKNHTCSILPGVLVDSGINA